MFCAKCGTELPDDSQFCKKCGSLLGKVQKAKNPYLWVSLGFLLLLILLSLIPAFTNTFPNPEAIGRTVGTLWLLTLAAIALVRTVRKRILKRQH
jgi:predicted nucleic acid-binding Zn ribbon protein